MVRGSGPSDHHPLRLGIGNIGMALHGWVNRSWCVRSEEKYSIDVGTMVERRDELTIRCLLMHEPVLGELSRRKGFESGDVEKSHVFGRWMGLWIVELSDEVW